MGRLLIGVQRLALGTTAANHGGSILRRPPSPLTCSASAGPYCSRLISSCGCSILQQTGRCTHRPARLNQGAHAPDLATVRSCRACLERRSSAAALATSHPKRSGNGGLAWGRRRPCPSARCQACTGAHRKPTAKGLGVRHTSCRSRARYNPRAEWPGASTTREAAMVEPSARGKGGMPEHRLGRGGRGVCTTCVRATGWSLQYNSGPKGAPSSQSQGPACQLHARQAASLHDDVLHLGAKPHLAPKMDEVLPAPLKGAMARRPGVEQSARTPIARQYSRLCSKTLASAARGIAGPQNRDPTPT